MKTDPIRLEVFKHRFAATAEEMGAVLQKASYSPNIKERRDFSCALFDADGKMIAQAAHIPVHLGSMPLSVQAAIHDFPDMQPGDVIILNDPFRGGTHLPDITLVSPVFTPLPTPVDEFSDGMVRGAKGEGLFGFVASRAHHSDVGGMSPGSMPVAREIYQEGIIIPPIKLVVSGETNQAVWNLLLANVRTPEERAGDLWAQIASNQRGSQRLQEMVLEYGGSEIRHYMNALLDYTERMTRRLLETIPNGEYHFRDYLDNDGINDQPILIQVMIRISGDTATVDFSGSASQQQGSVNAVYAITLSAVYYVFRCLIGLDVPNNAGCLVPIKVIAPEGSVVNARFPAPVAGGNVETSQRIVDVLLGALAQAAPDRIPAASQGTMNNVTIGGADSRTGEPRPFAYYETIGGGMGALPNQDGPSAVHSHMTNTLNTPVEALEYAYPLMVRRYEIRRGSGGEGKFSGGDGIRRDVEMLTNVQVTLLTERRERGPYGMNGGQPGVPGQNLILRDGEEIPIPSKGSIELKSGDILSIQTPGGGGFGKIGASSES
ncbi:MAG: hydantoinase B/oxoprolinase family protein [Chloroflexi bacterium]|nr:hydantoinase B/oxoprolinase family protein [Chloroflexota bacterium]MBU1662105.1 hydantoinase B/oxoprolinase family protein [Chloroflexota bacterium]